MVFPKYSSPIMTKAMLIFALLAVSSALDMSIISYDNNPILRSDEEVMTLYEEWLVTHGKSYNSLGEKEKRFHVFKDNLRFIDEHNTLENLTYMVGLNRFADLTNDEYRTRYLGFKPRVGDVVKKKLTNGYLPRVVDDAPDKNAKVVSIDDYVDVPVNDEIALKKVVAQQPTSVAIEAGGRDFQFYYKGIFNGKCGTALDHGVAAVGYGTEDGKDYWIVRNSWGYSWGENGYIRMERNLAGTSTGKCGIAVEPSYPIKAGANPPNPGPSPPSPVVPPTVCDSYYTCPESTTCCCVYQWGKSCYAWGCCPLEGATCCDDHYSCCPHDYPVCDINAGTCLMSKNNPIGIKATRRTPAMPRWAHGSRGMKSSA
ncbi:hypothetical protein ACFE04_005753 [Oxalis oulophora]